MADGRQARWEDHNVARRQQVIAAARQLVEAGDVELHVRRIAELAGLSRSVVYRLFTDRAELDRALQGSVLDEIVERIHGQLTLDATPRLIIERVISTYVDWAGAHPRLLRVIDNSGVHEGEGALYLTIGQVSEQILDLLLLPAALAGTEVPEQDRALADSVVFGAAMGVFGSVRRWILSAPGQQGTDRLVATLGANACAAFEQLASDLGLDLTLDRPLSTAAGSGAPSRASA